ncbi:MAG TPA: beta-ketoacyl-ACP synthase III [Egibacteraceae bacterium]|nr:beta-ketoacyl-ACP synthase III [Egibacteraceae bacterium]
MRAVIAGLGTAVPSEVVTNADLASRLDTSDEWIRSRTGIAQRHVAPAGIATADLATQAGAEALKSSGDTHADAVVLATMTPDRVCPPSAPTVATRLGLPAGLAFDLNAACSGFVYGLAVADALVRAGAARRVLLIGADVMSRVVDPDDRNTAVLFGDGAGAVVVEAGDDGPGAVTALDLGADGEGADLLAVDAGGSRLPAELTTVLHGGHYLRMDGREVYRQAVTGMAASCSRLLAAAGVAATDVDHLVAHQANARILSAVAGRLGIAPERCVVNVDRFGNTTAASVPLAMADLHDAGAAAGALVLLTAFGAGLTWGSALVRWPDLARR